MFDCSLRSLRIALWSPPTSSSLGDEKRVPSLLLSTAAHDPGERCPVVTHEPARAAGPPASDHVAAAEGQQREDDRERDEDRPVRRAVNEAYCVLDNFKAHAVRGDSLNRH